MTRLRNLFLFTLGVFIWIGVSGCQSGEGQARSAEELAALLDDMELPETNIYAIDTPAGRLVVELYDETPLHRDNFKRLVEDEFYDGTTFHRVIEGFVIQGGDPHTRNEEGTIGEGGPGYQLPAEIHPAFFHRRGALAAAREDDEVNPDRASSGSQFYVVQGRVHDEAELDEVELVLQQRLGDESVTIPDSLRSIYTTDGGTPQLDGQYTVFGQLLEGFDVLDAIAAADTPRTAEKPSPGAHVDLPLEDIPMTVTPLEEYDGAGDRE